MGTQVGMRMQFARRFGRPIEEFTSVERAVEGLKPKTRLNYINELSNFFLWLNEDPDQVIEQRKKDVMSDDENTQRYERKVKQYLQMLQEERKLAGRSVERVSGRIQGFFSNNLKRYSLDSSKLKISKAQKNVIRSDE